MDGKMDKSFSDTNINMMGTTSTAEITPPNYVSQRLIKRRRECDCSGELETFKEEIKQMIQSLKTSQETEMKKITPTLIEIQQTNRNIENSLAFLTSQNEELKKKVEQFELQARKDRESISLLEDKIEELQRDRRKQNVEIKNVPREDEENRASLINMIMNLSKNVGHNLAKSDIKDIYRVRSTKGGSKNTPIVVETSSTIIKTDFLKACKSFNRETKEKLRTIHLGFTKNENTPVFVSEQLTDRGSRLFFLARDLAKSKAYKFCWTSFGKIYVRKDETSPIIMIRSEGQVHHLLQETP